MDKQMTIYIGFAAVLLVGIVAGNLSTRGEEKPPTYPVNIPVKPEVQKYRFGIQCPDGSRVEYVAVERLSKKIVCKPDPE
jgi:hypothetical protein